MKLSSLDPKATWFWRVQSLLRLMMFWGPVTMMASVGLGSIAGSSIGAVFFVASMSLFTSLAMLWPALQYEHFRYGIREHDLLVQRGVLFRQRSSIPHNRIQHVDTRQGPIERLFGLSRVAVYTASGMSADGSIPCLATETAEAIRDQLARLGGDDGV